MLDEERNYWLGFSVFSGIGPIKFKRLISQFGSAKDAWEASVFDLTGVLRERLAEKFDRFRNKFSISDYARILLSKGLSLLTLKDEGYPQLLSKIKNPPFLLYVKGNTEILLRQMTDQNDRIIAVVGTRRTTSYGREVTKILTQDLVMSGFTIVSGLAIGIDAVSHGTAIETHGKTIAVLGCGVDCCYPRENQSIYNSIIASGSCVVSEYPLAQLPTKGSFPSRNRIIAGLSAGVLVTEGAEDSGSLITASYARKFGRPIFAVPGPITSSMSKGPYKLIAKGAKLVTSAKDILDELGVQEKSIKGGKSIKSIKGGNKEEDMILKVLENEPMHFDEIVRETGLQSSSVGSMLSVMEMKGMVKSLEGGMFSI